MCMYINIFMCYNRYNEQMSMTGGNMDKTKDKLTDLRKASDTRSRRVQILLTPRTHDKLKEISENTGASVNEIINQAIETFIEDL